MCRSVRSAAREAVRVLPDPLVQDALHINALTTINARLVVHEHVSVSYIHFGVCLTTGTITALVHRDQFNLIDRRN